MLLYLLLMLMVWVYVHLISFFTHPPTPTWWDNTVYLDREASCFTMRIFYVLQSKRLPNHTHHDTFDTAPSHCPDGAPRGVCPCTDTGLCAAEHRIHPHHVPQRNQHSAHWATATNVRLFPPTFTWDVQYRVPVVPSQCLSCKQNPSPKLYAREFRIQDKNIPCPGLIHSVQIFLFGFIHYRPLWFVLHTDAIWHLVHVGHKRINPDGWPVCNPAQNTWLTLFKRYISVKKAEDWPLTTYSKTSVRVSLVWMMSWSSTMLACFRPFSRDAAEKQRARGMDEAAEGQSTETDPGQK